MRSDVPSESATVPLPDHDPLKPANGPDWAWLTDTDNMSAAPTPAAVIACPNKPEPNNFISNFPIQMTFLYKPRFPRYLQPKPIKTNIYHRLPRPGRAMRAYQTSVHLPVAVPHAFVLIRPTTGVGTSAHAICGLILTSRRVCHCFCRRVEEHSDAYEGDREEKMPCHV